jgi:hypothetical protein
MLCGATAMPCRRRPAAARRRWRSPRSLAAGWLPGSRGTAGCGPGCAGRADEPEVGTRAPAPGRRNAARVTCSTSRPRAIDPLAWTTTPPRDATVVTCWLPDGAGAAGCAAPTARTVAGDSCPGFGHAAEGGASQCRRDGSTPPPLPGRRQVRRRARRPVRPSRPGPVTGMRASRTWPRALRWQHLLARAERGGACRSQSIHGSQDYDHGQWHEDPLAVRLFTSPSLLDRAAAQRPSQALRVVGGVPVPAGLACGRAAAEAARGPSSPGSRRAGLGDPAARREPGRGPLPDRPPRRASRSGPCARRVRRADRALDRNPAARRCPGRAIARPAAIGPGPRPRRPRPAPPHRRPPARPGRRHIPAARRGRVCIPAARGRRHTRPAGRVVSYRACPRGPGRCHTPGLVGPGAGP